MTDYEPILLISLLFGFYASWNIGANDVSNAMGTSVGSKALTIRQAVVIAAIFEFCGAVFFGSHVSETLQHGLINPQVFADNPSILVNGMLASLLACGIWLQLATFLGLPVSTTHAIVGAIVGFGAVVGGTGAIYWDEVFSIAGSWVASPLIGAAAGFVFFSVLRKRVFYNANPLTATKKILPWIVACLVIVFSLVGLWNVIAPNGDMADKLVIIFSMAILGALLTILYCRYMKVPEKASDGIHGEFHRVEKIFGSLQIFSACLMAFSHGANDVANAIGPLAAIINITETGSTNFQATIPTWVLVLGGLGIVAGLATWGWRVIETIGKKITELTPSRGFSAEFAAALTVLLASRLGFPVSTTHTLVGAVLGVGLAGGLGAINLRMIRDIILAWIVTIPAGAAIAIICYYIIDAIF